MKTFFTSSSYSQTNQRGTSLKNLFSHNQNGSFFNIRTIALGAFSGIGALCYYLVSNPKPPPASSSQPGTLPPPNSFPQLSNPPSEEQPLFNDEWIQERVRHIKILDLSIQPTSSHRDPEEQHFAFSFPNPRPPKPPTTPDFEATIHQPSRLPFASTVHSSALALGYVTLASIKTPCLLQTAVPVFALAVFSKLSALLPPSLFIPVVAPQIPTLRLTIQAPFEPQNPPSSPLLPLPAVPWSNLIRTIAFESAVKPAELLHTHTAPQLPASFPVFPPLKFQAPSQPTSFGYRNYSIPWINNCINSFAPQSNALLVLPDFKPSLALIRAASHASQQNVTFLSTLKPTEQSLQDTQPKRLTPPFFLQSTSAPAEILNIHTAPPLPNYPPVFLPPKFQTPSQSPPSYGNKHTSSNWIAYLLGLGLLYGLNKKRNKKNQNHPLNNDELTSRMITPLALPELHPTTFAMPPQTFTRPRSVQNFEFGQREHSRSSTQPKFTLPPCFGLNSPNQRTNPSVMIPGPFSKTPRSQLASSPIAVIPAGSQPAQSGLLAEMTSSAACSVNSSPNSSEPSSPLTSNVSMSELNQPSTSSLIATTDPKLRCKKPHPIDNEYLNSAQLLTLYKTKYANSRLAEGQITAELTKRTGEYNIKLTSNTGVLGLHRNSVDRFLQHIHTQHQRSSWK